MGSIVIIVGGVVKYKDLLDTDVLDLGKQARPVEGSKFKPGDKVTVEGTRRGVILRSRKMKYHITIKNKPFDEKDIYFYIVKLDNGRIAEGTQEELKMDPIEYMKKNKQ